MRMPVVFFGHGNPMNALASNRYTDAWAKVGNTITRPKGILCISAHWYFPGGTALTISTSPRTIHDFGAFPAELFAVQYPAPGDPTLAQRVQQLLDPLPVQMDDGRWGLDHGAWSVLTHVYPKADIPVVQLSIDSSQPAQFHFDIGQRLATLREEGILIVGSGNLVHNLRAYKWDESAVEPYDWASEFDTRARDLLLARSYQPLIAYPDMGRAASLSIPTPDHYLPLLYVLGAGLPDETPSFPVSGIEGGSISMLSVLLGDQAATE